MANLQRKTRIRTLYNLKRLVFRKKHKITYSFADHIKLEQKMTLTQASWINNGKSKQNKKSGQYTVRYCYIQGAPQKKQYHCFFREAPTIFLKIEFYSCNLNKTVAMQIKKTRIRRPYILKILSKGCSTQYQCFFCLKFQEKK